MLKAIGTVSTVPYINKRCNNSALWLNDLIVTSYTANCLGIAFLNNNAEPLQRIAKNIFTPKISATELSGERSRRAINAITATNICAKASANRTNDIPWG